MLYLVSMYRSWYFLSIATLSLIWYQSHYLLSSYDRSMANQRLCVVTMTTRIKLRFFLVFFCFFVCFCFKTSLWGLSYGIWHQCAPPGQQKVREHGSGALRKWQTKLRKWCQFGKKNKKTKRKTRKENKWEMRRKNERKKKRGKEKERRRGQNILIFLKIIE